MLPFGLPVLFCGTGEGTDFVIKHNVGYVANSGDHRALAENIAVLSNMSDSEYASLSSKCLDVVRNELNFDSQMDRLVNYIKSL